MELIYVWKLEKCVDEMRMNKKIQYETYLLTRQVYEKDPSLPTSDGERIVEEIVPRANRIDDVVVYTIY